MYPGASGVLSFTVTPYTDNLDDITISLSRIVVTKNNGDADATLNLLKGHLLFFEHKNGDYYSSRVTDAIAIAKGRFCKEGSNKTTEPVSINLYWIWPEYFQNYVLTGSTGYYRNLFASVGDAGSDYNTLLADMNSNPTHYYSGAVGDASSVTVSPEMSSSAMTIGSALFNNADEKLGDEVDYLKIKLTAREGTTSGSN